MVFLMAPVLVLGTAASPLKEFLLHIHLRRTDSFVASFLLLLMPPRGLSPRPNLPLSVCIRPAYYDSRIPEAE